jgi:peptidoglycan hydrolase CwlO-like protein
MSATTLLSSLYQKQDKGQLTNIKETIESKLKELDVFFTEYLEVFDERMNASVDNQNDPVWKAYQARYREYLDAKADLKMANYYLGML